MHSSAKLQFISDLLKSNELFLWAMLHPSTKFHGNQLSIFFVYSYKVKHKQHQKHKPLAEIEEDVK